MIAPLRAPQMLRSGRWVDLTRLFDPCIPHCPAFETERLVVPHDHAAADSVDQEYHHVGQWSTHLDAPVHFVFRGRALDQIPKPAGGSGFQRAVTGCP